MKNIATNLPTSTLLIEGESYHSLIETIIARYPEKQRDDLRQECYMKILTLHPTFKGTPLEFRKYVSKTIKYHCINYMDRTLRTGVLSLESLASADNFQEYTFNQKDHSSDGTPEQTEAKMDLVPLFKKLTPNQCKALTYYHSHGYSAREIMENFPELGYNSTDAIYNLINKFKI